MAATESFRVQVLSSGQRMPPAQLNRRFERFSSAVEKILRPMKLGRRLQFHSLFDGNSLWLLVYIEHSGQTGLFEDLSTGEIEDFELRSEVKSSEWYLKQAMQSLRELASLQCLTPAALERFIQQSSSMRGQILGVDLMKVGLLEKSQIHLGTSNCALQHFDFSQLPKLHTSSTLFTIVFRVIFVGKGEAKISLSKEARQLLGAEKSLVSLLYGKGLAGKPIRATLFGAMEDAHHLKWKVRCTKNLLGDFHSVYVESMCQCVGTNDESTNALVSEMGMNTHTENH
jgi:hypothetical protein